MLISEMNGELRDGAPLPRGRSWLAGGSSSTAGGDVKATVNGHDSGRNDAY